MKRNRFLSVVLSLSIIVSMMIPGLETAFASNNLSIAKINSVKAEKLKTTDGYGQKVIITYKSGTDEKEIVNQIGKAKGKVKKQYRNVPVVSASLPAAEVAKLKTNNKNILCVEPDAVVTVEDFEDWGIETTRTHDAWTAGYKGAGVKIAVIDTGIATHSDLVISGGVSTVDYTTSFQDDYGHGTHAAGIIGAKNNGFGSVGVAPDSSIYAVKALTNTGNGYVSDIIEGIDWSIANGMDVINMSLGTSTDVFALHTAVDNAYNAGIVVVASAGNKGTADAASDTILYPAKYSSVIAVAATDESNVRAYFSGTGNEVDIAAPGVDILSTYLGDQYAYMSGTSMACPYVAGAVAVLLQEYPDITRSQIQAKLESTAIDLGAPGKDRLYGSGLLQLTVPAPAEPQEIELLDTTTTVKTIRTRYYYRSQPLVQVRVVDENGANAVGATVSMEMTSPTGEKTTKTTRVNSAGRAYFSYKFTAASPKGYYQLAATTVEDKKYDTSVCASKGFIIY